MFPTAQTDFGLNMLRHAPSSVSLVMSPISVIYALIMLHAGSKGTTMTEINSAISRGQERSLTFPGLGNIYVCHRMFSESTNMEGYYAVQRYYSELLDQIMNSTNGVKSRINNSFYLNEKYDILPNYEQTLRTAYKTKIERVDFEDADEAAKHFDDAIAKMTEGKIRNMLNEENVEKKFALDVNANYFTAEWKFKFDKSSNSKGTFYSSGGNKHEVVYMNAFNQERLHAEDDDVQVLSLPYLDTSFALNIFLPKNGFGLHEVRARLTGERVQSLLSKLEKTNISVTIPKMKIEAYLNLEEVMKRMGVIKASSSNADLTDINRQIKLRAFGPAHRAIIEVDEDGTTAAAATYFKRFKSKSVIVGGRRKFDAVHPFLFVITKNNIPLFMGQFV
ncbi:unnamed protein product [Haemonchus placei]|uniref:SERPIN domain-containing protein n=1 Tax=Haemonchus placei TaxID=6290 RepID=A0A0N4WRW2_HAEPC|nr:unnamed protein product [Haemonchus placei]